MAKRKSNWEKLQQQDILESTKYRNVHEDQQTDRSYIPEKQSMLGRQIATGVIALFLFFAVYFFLSVISFAQYSVQRPPAKPTPDVGPYYVEEKLDGYYKDDKWVQENYVPGHTAYFALDAQGNKIEGTEYASAEEVPVPDWYKDAENSAMYKKALEQYEAALKEYEKKKDFGPHMAPTLKKLFLSLLVGGLTGLAIYPFMVRNLQAQNVSNDTADINQYHNDQHIAYTEEIQRKFDWFPDVGAHCPVQVSSMISHVALQNKGLNKVLVAQRADKDILDENGEVIYLKGEVLRDDDGNPIMKKLSLMDEQFMEDLFKASDLPDNPVLRKYYDTTQIPYNPDGGNREKQGSYKTVADFINATWTFPEYEPQRPGGAYLVDPAPVNTMCLAITRAGKGQTIIEC